ncbi:DUF6415 family natural product biosynthesis protein [Streptomyces sp. NPDC096324]|uniref:DUF6415 family natural product biosynthesis protein n=1 Tax=Streptomyces sp. NPDC096324 TaxID=3366085 RepID=UPI003813E1A7
MRACTRRLLAEDARVPASEELDRLTLQLRGHIELLIPEVEETAGRLPKDDIPRYCALACTGEARGKLSARPQPGHATELAHARRLARVVNALVDHHENLDAG